MGTAKEPEAIQSQCENTNPVQVCSATQDILTRPAPTSVLRFSFSFFFKNYLRPKRNKTTAETTVWRKKLTYQTVRIPRAGILQALRRCHRCIAEISEEKKRAERNKKEERKRSYNVLEKKKESDRQKDCNILTNNGHQRRQPQSPSGRQQRCR